MTFNFNHKLPITFHCSLSAIHFFMFQTPILLIIFNRPDTTRQVFETIRNQKPRFLYVAADGPRTGNENDIVLCKAARDIIKVNWNCELRIFFREENRGCGYGPAEAITWFFENVEKGIILEDDCILSTEGFKFYEDLLEYFKNDNNVNVITANNLMLKWKSQKASYILAGPGTPTMGCWASWKKAWNNFDYEMNLCADPNVNLSIKHSLRFTSLYLYWKKIFIDLNHTPRKDVWDYQWHFARCISNSVTIVSSVNMVSNIGFNEQATHTKIATGIAGLPIYSCKFPLIHPKAKRDYLYDWIVFQRFYNPVKRSLIKKIFMKAVRLYFS